MKKFELDDIDWLLLRELQTNARSTYQAMGDKVGLTIPAVIKRVDRLVSAGVIAGFRAEINPKRVGLAITAFLRVGENVRHLESLVAIIKKSREVSEFHRCAGSDYSFIMKVHVHDLSELEAVVNRFSTHGSVHATVVSSSRVKPFTKSLTASRKDRRHRTS